MTTLSKIPGVFCGFSLALCRERDEAHSELQDRHQHMSPRYVVFHGGGGLGLQAGLCEACESLSCVEI